MCDETRQSQNNVSQRNNQKEVEPSIVDNIEKSVDDYLSDYIKLLQKNDEERKERIKNEASKAIEWIPKAVKIYVERKALSIENAKQAIHLTLTIENNSLVMEEKGVKEEIIYTAEDSEYFIDALKFLSKLSKEQNETTKRKITIEVEESGSILTIVYSMV